MKKIAYILHDKELGGANLSFLDFISEVDKSKYEIYVILPRKSKKIQDILNNFGIDNKHIIIGNYCELYKNKNKNKRKIQDIIKMNIKFIYSFSIQILTLKILEKKLKKINVCIIHSNSFIESHGVDIAKKLGIPHVWHIREFVGKNFDLQHYNQNKIKKMCNYSSAIFISDIIKKYYEKNYAFKNTTIIYDKVNFNKSYHKTRRFMEDGICNILFVGSLIKNKGINDALDCIKMINSEKIPAKLIICGDGPLKNEIKQYINCNNMKNVECLGFIDELEKIRQNIDIAISCSTNEALGRTLIEAFYYENLMVASLSKYNCSKYIINDGINGYLYDKQKKNDLYFTILKVIKNKNKIPNILNYAKTTAIEKFNKNIFLNISKYYELIE